MPDRVMGRYELREKLASSATATVWRARDRRRRRDVALKVAAPDSADASRQLAAEAEAVGRLKHPNIVPILDKHFAGTGAALAFPLLDGETLARRLARDGRLPPADAAQIAEKVAMALAHAHGRGVVHRDVKPANVMLGRDGQVRLFDFGISATPERVGGGLVEPGMTTGTLPYMAPEQLAGQSPDPATDVYALGAVLYEMLSGRRPYAAATTEALAAEQQQPPPPIEDAPPKLATLAMEALDPDPLARPRASVLAARLHGWLAGSAEDETVVVPIAPPTSVVRAFGMPAPRASRSLAVPRPSGLAALAVTLLLVGGIAGTVALSVLNSQPAATLAPAITDYSGLGGSLWPTFPASPTPAPAQVGGGGSAGGGNGKGDHGGGNGKGKGH
jgi:serine/threonine protein kinase